MSVSHEQRRPRFYYGWVIAAVSTLANATVFGAGGASFSVFMGPMGHALGWSRTVLTGAVTMQSFTNLAVSPVVGRLLDRYGPRLIMVFGTVVACISYMLMSRIVEPWHFYVLFTIGFALGLNEMGGMVTSVVVSKWFIRRRGRALALASLGNQLGVIVIVPITGFLIAAIGWRNAWAMLGVGVAALVLIPTALFMRRTPEDMGLLPDGDPPEPAPPAAAGAEAPPPRPRREEPRWTPRQALRTRTLWLIIAGSNLAALTFSSLLYHLVPYFTDIGMDLATAGFVYALLNVGAIFSKIGWGFISEHVPVRYCLMCTYLGRMSGLLVLLLSRSPNRPYFYAAIAGPLSHSIGPLQAQIWADYYGRSFLGTLRGLIAPFSLLTSVFGPLFAAQTYDRMGSYEGAFWFLVITLFLASCITFFAVPPGPSPDQVQPAQQEGAQQARG